MKRGTAAIIILAVCLIFSITINNMLEHKAESVLFLAKAAVNTKESASVLEKEWNKELIFFKLFTDHSYFESIDRNIKMLQYLDGETYRDTCNKTVVDLIEFEEYLSFSLPNIF